MQIVDRACAAQKDMELDGRQHIGPYQPSVVMAQLAWQENDINSYVYLVVYNRDTIHRSCPGLLTPGHHEAGSV